MSVSNRLSLGVGFVLLMLNGVGEARADDALLCQNVAYTISPSVRNRWISVPLTFAARSSSSVSVILSDQAKKPLLVSSIARISAANPVAVRGQRASSVVDVLFNGVDLRVPYFIQDRTGAQSLPCFIHVTATGSQSTANRVAEEFEDGNSNSLADVIAEHPVTEGRHLYNDFGQLRAFPGVGMVIHPIKRKFLRGKPVSLQVVRVPGPQFGTASLGFWRPPLTKGNILPQVYDLSSIDFTAVTYTPNNDPSNVGKRETITVEVKADGEASRQSYEIVIDQDDWADRALAQDVTLSVPSGTQKKDVRIDFANSGGFYQTCDGQFGGLKACYLVSDPRLAAPSGAAYTSQSGTATIAQDRFKGFAWTVNYSVPADQVKTVNGKRFVTPFQGTDVVQAICVAGAYFKSVSVTLNVLPKK